MGLFSLFSKNKQEPAGQDSGYFSREDDEAAVRARSKRASSAGDGAAPRTSRKTRAVDDPVLPEKKRARRRLVGAIALALAVAVGLPMLLDSEPKPIASDIAIQIPSREKAAPLPLPAGPGETRPTAPTVPTVAPAAETLDQREQIVDPNEVKTVKLKGAEPEPAAKPVKAAEPQADARLEAKARAEAKEKAEAKARAEAKAKADAKAKLELEARRAEKEKADKAAEKAAEKAKPDDSARAQAILEGKAADKAKADAGTQKFVVQVAALGSQEKVDELQEKLSAAGIRAHTHKVSTPSGERIQVRVGPFSREEADRMRARLDKAGLGGSMVRPEGK